MSQLEWQANASTSTIGLELEVKVSNDHIHGRSVTLALNLDQDEKEPLALLVTSFDQGLTPRQMERVAENLKSGRYIADTGSAPTLTYDPGNETRPIYYPDGLQALHDFAQFHSEVDAPLYEVLAAEAKLPVWGTPPEAWQFMTAALENPEHVFLVAAPVAFLTAGVGLGFIMLGVWMGTMAVLRVVRYVDNRMALVQRADIIKAIDAGEDEEQ
ncbi:hypothetical protein [Streptomyces coeruleorubidus]|nr:hypothetical protein [Streptomyces coeruleorubidus]GGT71387.1 hypothetical protein GCM10010256_32490 [Streptomyces coeruleorubidus]